MGRADGDKMMNDARRVAVGGTAVAADSASLHMLHVMPEWHHFSRSFCFLYFPTFHRLSSGSRYESGT